MKLRVSVESFDGNYFNKCSVCHTCVHMGIFKSRKNTLILFNQRKGGLPSAIGSGLITHCILSCSFLD
jgi:hypothetical protein